jgi:serine/threonine protein kinase
VHARPHGDPGIDPARSSDAREAFCLTEPFERQAPPDASEPPDESTVLEAAITGESTLLDAGADGPHAPDDEPTRIRPVPIDPALRERELARGSIGGASAGGARRRRIGKYELRDKLGRGAFGVVFTARDPSLDRDVAIKVLRPTHLGNPTIVQRFLQEARATARIAHPGIVTIHDCGQVETTIGPTAYIAMELLSGETLTDRLTRCGRLAPDAAAEIVRQAASALEAAHRADVLHRDLKPDNLYIVPDPAIPCGERVKILDFGLAKLGHDGNTQLQTVFGTPRYMSPEQCRSTAQVDHRSDIYSLGCILFELVTGRPPFEGEVRQLLDQHQRATAPRARSFVLEVPPALDALVAEMLAKDPMVRPQTMGAVRRAVQRAVQRVADPAASEPAPPVEPPARGHPAPPRAESPRVVSPRAESPRVISPRAESPRVMLPPAERPTLIASRVDPDEASGEILVAASAPRPVIAPVSHASPTTTQSHSTSAQLRTIVSRLTPTRLFGLAAILMVLAVLLAWLTAG